MGFHQQANPKERRHRGLFGENAVLRYRVVYTGSVVFGAEVCGAPVDGTSQPCTAATFGNAEG